MKKGVATPVAFKQLELPPPFNGEADGLTCYEGVALECDAIALADAALLGLGEVKIVGLLTSSDCDAPSLRVVLRVANHRLTSAEH